MLDALIKGHCNFNQEEDGILQDGTAAYHCKGDVEVPIIYGDYFLTEAILRLSGQALTIW